jgi:four helix bundle protein
MSVESYEQLTVWQKAMDLAVEAYELSRRLPADERFGLIAQVRRAAASVPANIAEGHGRAHRGDYAHHLSIARGSVKEVEVHFLLAARLGYVASVDLATVRELCDHVSRMLTRLQRSLRR